MLPGTSATLLLIMVTISDGKKHMKRQVSLDDIIQGALNFVRPLIDTSQPLQPELMTAKKLQSEPSEERDAEILGVPKYSALEDVPICKSNSRICKFISCSAHNFKNDESISNLNLAAQILADTKLRKAITSSPSTLLTVCYEQGLSATQCKLFANAFQLLDRFISTIEPVGTVAKKLHRYIIKSDPYYDDSDAPPIPIHPGSYQRLGSQTWSIQRNNNSDTKPLLEEMQTKKAADIASLQQSEPSFLDGAQNSRDASNFSIFNATAISVPVFPILKDKPPLSSTTNSPALFTFPPLLFTFPTLATFASVVPATAPPSTSMNLMPKELQNFLMPHFDSKLLLPNMIPVPVPSLPASQESSNSLKPVRSRRSSDYYDVIETENNEMINRGASEHISAYENDQSIIENKKQDRNREGFLDCIRLLED